MFSGVINGQARRRRASHVIIICGGVGEWGTCGSEVNFRSMFQYHIELLRKGTIIYTSTCEAVQFDSCSGMTLSLSPLLV